MLGLGNRLRAVLNEVRGKRLADIGCDHGKVAALALLQGEADFVSAVDISPNSLDKAKKLAKKLNLLHKMEFLPGDGLTPLNYEPDSVVIAGMGGNEIVKILSQKRLNSRFILVAHQDVFVLRKYLQRNGYAALKDYAVEEKGKFYDIIVARAGESNYSDGEIYVGKNYPQSSVFIKKLKARKRHLERILNSADKEKLSSDIVKEWEEINNVLQD